MGERETLSPHLMSYYDTVDLEQCPPPQCISYREELVEKFIKLRGSEFWEGILQDTSLRGVRILNTTCWDEVKELKLLYIKLRESVLELKKSHSPQEIYEKCLPVRDYLDEFLHKESQLRKFVHIKNIPHLKILI